MRRSAPSAITFLTPIPCAVLLAIILDAIPARAQSAQIDALAAQMAGAISHAKEKQKRTAMGLATATGGRARRHTGTREPDTSFERLVG